MLKLLSTPAPAKINLFLHVTGRRVDGYHELDSILVPISLYDRVGIAVRPAASSAAWLRSDSDRLGPDEQNLVVRATLGFLSEFQRTAEVMIDLQKRIPVGAGLGGGSSDAGAVLRMLARLFRIDDRPRLLSLAVRIGADVPWFLEPVPSRVRGIGEQIERLEDFPQFDVVLAVPPVNVATAVIFRALRPEDWSGPASPESVVALRDNPISADRLVNDLAAVTVAKYPIIGELQQRLQQVGALRAVMSGSGSAVFGIFSSREAARKVELDLRHQYPDVLFYMVRVLTGGRYQF